MLEGWGVWVMRPENDEHSVSEQRLKPIKGKVLRLVGLVPMRQRKKSLELSSGKETRRI